MTAMETELAEARSVAAPTEPAKEKSKHTAAAATAPHSDPPRTREHAVPLRLPTQAHRQGGPGRVGGRARAFLDDWHAKPLCDDYGGYKAGFGDAVTEIGWLAHARCKFHDLHVANKSQLAA